MQKMDSAFLQSR